MTQIVNEDHFSKHLAVSRNQHSKHYLRRKSSLDQIWNVRHDFALNGCLHTLHSLSHQQTGNRPHLQGTQSNIGTIQNYWGTDTVAVQ
jgi:hypothetical protein